MSLIGLMGSAEMECAVAKMLQLAAELAKEMYLTLIGHPAYKLTISSGRVEIIARAFLKAVSPEWLGGIDKRFPKEVTNG